MKDEKHMKPKLIILLIIPILIGLTVFFNFQQKEIIPEENIIEEKYLPITDNKQEKTDDDILKEIEEKYDEVNDITTIGNYKILPREWQNSGPFSIDRKEYALGEKIFLKAENLKMNDKGQISILRTLNETHYSVWRTYDFDGEKNSAFNIYFEPRLFKIKEICDKDDLLGDWVMVFQNTDYENLTFKIIDQIVPGDEIDFNNPVC